MNMQEFEKVTIERVNECLKVMTSKSEQYSTETDKLHNFKVAGELQGCTPEKALGGMMSKHTVSIYDLINDVETGKNIPLEMWDEKIGDHINYLLLLNALVRERRTHACDCKGE